MIVLAVIALFMLFLFTHGLGILALVTGVTGTGIWYVRDVKRHDRVRCRVCTGSGDERSPIGGKGLIRRPFGDCWCCGGKKAHPRLALRLIDSGKYKRIQDEINRAKGKT